MKFEVWIYGHTYIIDHTLIYDAVFRGVREWFFGICKTTPAACILGGWQCHGWCLGPLLYRAGHLRQKTEISWASTVGVENTYDWNHFEKILFGASKRLVEVVFGCIWPISEDSWVSLHFRSFYILAPIKCIGLTATTGQPCAKQAHGCHVYICNPRWGPSIEIDPKSIKNAYDEVEVDVEIASNEVVVYIGYIYTLEVV